MTPWLEAILNHLWQSTLFALSAALLVRALRHNRASLRYAVWLAASIKFLVPFAALAAVGARLAWRPAEPIATPEIAVTLGTLGQPFSDPSVSAVAPLPVGVVTAPGTSALPVVLGSLWIAGCLACALLWYLRWRRLSTVISGAQALTGGRVHEALQRLARRERQARRPLAVASVDAPIEPGVFGLLRPVLIWPRGFEDRLDDNHLQALLSHELVHVRRRDNLTMSIHMVIRALCWFHPLMWWIGARLVEERERACDEEVVRLGSAPDVYAEGILQTCRHCVEAPAVCAAGIAGGHLRARIEQIMRDQTVRRLGVAKTLAIATAGAMLVVGPIAAGATFAPRLAAQEPAVAAGEDPAFDVVSIRRNESGDSGKGRSSTNPFEGRWFASNTLEGLLSFIYDVRREDVLDGPAWIETEVYDIQARYPTVPRDTPRDEWENLLFRMRRRMLAERFGAVIHEVDRETRGYALRVADDGRLGPQLTVSTADCSSQQIMTQEQAQERKRELSSLEQEAGRALAAGQPVQPRDVPGGCGTYGTGGRLSGRGTTLASLVSLLSRMTGEIVEDRTGLEGRYDFELQYSPMPVESASPATAGPVLQEHPPIDVALREQLGLELVGADVVTDAIVVEHIERPTPN